MPGLVDCGVVLRTALPSGNAFFTSFDQSLQGTVYYEVKTKLSLFQRPFKMKKNGVFFFCNISSRSRDIQAKRIRVMTSSGCIIETNHKIKNISGNIQVL